MSSIYLEGVIVCVNYSDFLAHTLPENKSQFDNLVVVTDLKDTNTVNVCNKYNVRCVQTNAFYENGGSFNKGAGINVGIQCLQNKDWVLHLDADIYLPPLTRHMLEMVKLDKSKIYGADRLMCPDFKSWMDYRAGWEAVHEAWVFTHLNHFPVGSRIVQYGDSLPGGKPDGWVPIGFFQLWNPSASGVISYPDRHGAADRSDVLHAKQYPRERREILPEVVVIHLESEPCKMGMNWSGRKTTRFGYNPVANPTVFQRLFGWVGGLWQWVIGRRWLAYFFAKKQTY